MSLSPEQRREYRAIAHNLKPVIIVGDKGLSEGLQEELERALNDHELIKIQFRLTEREDRRALMEELCAIGKCELVQTIGKMALVYRKNPKPNKQLSNIHRFQA